MVATDAEPEPEDENLRKTNISWLGRCFHQMCPTVTMSCLRMEWVSRLEGCSRRRPLYVEGIQYLLSGPSQYWGSVIPDSSIFNILHGNLGWSSENIWFLQKQVIKLSGHDWWPCWKCQDLKGSHLLEMLAIDSHQKASGLQNGSIHVFSPENSLGSQGSKQFYFEGAKASSPRTAGRIWAQDKLDQPQGQFAQHGGAHKWQRGVHIEMSHLGDDYKN